MNLYQLPFSVLSEIYVLVYLFYYGLNQEFLSVFIAYVIYSLFELFFITAVYTKSTSGSYSHLTINRREFKGIPKFKIALILLCTGLFSLVFFPVGVLESFNTLDANVVRDIIFFSLLAIVSEAPRFTKRYKKTNEQIELDKKIIDFRISPLLLLLVTFILVKSHELVTETNIHNDNVVVFILATACVSVIAFDLYIWKNRSNEYALNQKLSSAEKLVYKISFFPLLFFGLVIYIYFIS